MKWKRKPKKEETEEEKESYHLSWFTQALFFVTVFSSMFIKSLMAVSILFCFLIISTGFDAWRQSEERKTGGEK